MGTGRTDRYRTVELVVHVGRTQHVASVFAVGHDSGTQSRRLVRRALRAGAGQVTSADELLDVLQAALDDLRAGNGAPPR